MALDKYCSMGNKKFVLRNCWWQRLLMGGKLIDFGFIIHVH